MKEEENTSSVGIAMKMTGKIMALEQGIFIRHSGDETLVWNPRTGGCSLMRDCQPFLEEISRVWREESEIVAAIAAKFGCAEEEV